VATDAVGAKVAFSLGKQLTLSLSLSPSLSLYLSLFCPLRLFAQVVVNEQRERESGKRS